MDELNRLDLYVHRNPAFGSYCLHWLCDGYESDTPTDDTLRMPFLVGMVGLMLLTPDHVRRKLPETANGSLGKVFDGNPDFAISVAEQLPSWTDSFWESVRYGVACKTLTITHDGLCSARSPKPKGELAEELRKRGRALGRLLRREGNELGILTLVGVSAG